MDVPSPSPQASKQTCSNAKLALIFSCCGFITPFFVGSILGIVFGHKALAELRSQPGLCGRNLAIWALVVGYATIPLGIIGVFMLLWYLGR
ncbi:MAG: DUF4190 domain-containing protein [Limisphaerales bacterium]